jgi:hypothetical protein
MARSHREQEEAYGRIWLDNETQELRIWDVIRVAPEVVRAFESGPDRLDIIAGRGALSPRKAMASARLRRGPARRSQSGCFSRQPRQLSRRSSG